MNSKTLKESAELVERIEKLPQFYSNKKEETLNEKSLNRAISFMNKYDIAIITAFRYEFTNETPNTLKDIPQDWEKKNDKPYQYTRKEKESRNRDLLAVLLKRGYGVTKIAGNYIENYKEPDAKEVGETSFFVVNLNNDENFYNTLFELSEYYNQDSFLFKPKGSEEAFAVGTNNARWPGYGNQENIGKLHRNVENEYLSRIGTSSFAFSPEERLPHNNDPHDFNARKAQRVAGYEKKDNVFETYHNYTGRTRQVIGTISERVIKDIDRLHLLNETTNR